MQIAHKTLLIGAGLQSILDFSRNLLESDLVHLAAQIPGISINFEDSLATSEKVTLLDAAAGEKALASIRLSIANAMAWEQTRRTSGLAPLSTWIQDEAAPGAGKLRPAIYSTLTDFVDHARIETEFSESVAKHALISHTVSDSTRKSIFAATTAWSEKAHVELRDRLDLAFASRDWRRLKWYKLFWRSDDVAMLLNEMLEKSWLVGAERGAVYLCGRLEGAGLMDDSPAQISPPEDLLVEESDKEIPTTTEPNPTSLPPTTEGPPINPNNISTLIPTARTALSTRTVPSLQALSQSLVLQTASGLSLTTAVSALAYIGTSTTTLFEAGSVFAFGLVVSLKRLQSKWEGAREFWMKDVREEGRTVLKETEGFVKGVLESGGRVGELGKEGVEKRRRVEESMEGVERCLREVQGEEEVETLVADGGLVEKKSEASSTAP